MWFIQKAKKKLILHFCSFTFITLNVVDRHLPASTAFLAATLKSLITKGISWVSSRLGVEKVAISMPLDRTWGLNNLSVLDIGACPLGWKPAPGN